MPKTKQDPLADTPLFVVSVRYCWDNSPDSSPQIHGMWEGPTVSFPKYALGGANVPAELFANRWDFSEAWKPLRVFKTQAKAETFARQADDKIRTTCNPFLFRDNVADWSDFDEPRLRDWLMDAGLEPPVSTKKSKAKKPKFDARLWRVWYHKHAKSMTPLQRAKVWEAMSKVRFHRVEELA